MVILSTDLSSRVVSSYNTSASRVKSVQRLPIRSVGFPVVTACMWVTGDAESMRHPMQ